jgi:hypothetical protein
MESKLRRIKMYVHIKANKAPALHCM